jgi:hypothetical protein
VLRDPLDPLLCPRPKYFINNAKFRVLPDPPFGFWPFPPDTFVGSRLLDELRAVPYQPSNIQFPPKHLTDCAWTPRRNFLTFTASWWGDTFALRKELGDTLFESKIRVNTKAKSAPSLRQTILEYERSEPAAPEPVETIDVKPASAEAAEAKGARPAVEPKPVRAVAPVPKPVERPRVEKKEARGAGGRKADILTERLTVQISPEMRDEVERIAQELQRAKTSKEERITANTVMRVAIQLITKKFKLKSGDAPNNEEELYKLVERIVGG